MLHCLSDMAPNWSTLPLDLLTAVAFKLETFEDFIYFSIVCWSWNRASSSIKHLWRAKPVVPWLLLAENTQDNPHCVRKILNINNENKCYRPNLPETFGGRCWGSPYGWVAMPKLDFTVQLFNPITKATISFPSLETLPYLPENCPEYNFERRDYYHWCLGLFLTKLIVLKVSQNGHHEFVIMIIYDFHQRLAFARHGDPSWTSVLIKETKETSVRIFDVVAMDNHVYAIYDEAAIAYWEIKEFFGFELVKPMDYLPGDHENFDGFFKNDIQVYLIQSNTDLLMVLRHTEEVQNVDHTDFDYDIVYRTFGFEIFKVNHIDKHWENVENLGDVALFVGDNSSMSLSVAHAKCLQSSSIYFTDDVSEYWSIPTEFGGHDMGVFDFKSSQILRFYEGDDTRSSFCAPTWFIPQF